MEQQIVTFYVGLYVVVWVLFLFPRSIVTRIAFSWLGPVPREHETLARYQLRWGFYALDGLGQIAFLFVVLYGAAFLYPGIEENQWFLAFAAFALPIGGGIALVAALGFFFKAAKAMWVGPNPVYCAQQ